jgi:polysaccharide biosynthesis/export protein
MLDNCTRRSFSIESGGNGLLSKYIVVLTAVLLIMNVTSAVCDEAIAEAVPEDYRITAEDVIQIDVWGEPDLSKIQVQVTPDGMITVPFVGSIKAEGYTQQELIDKIAKGYVDADILVDPKVSIRLMVMHRPKVYVLGRVNRPGVVEFKDGDTIMEAIAQAGSYREDALLTRASLTKKDSNLPPVELDLKALFLEGDLSQNRKLENGDTIHIPEDTLNKYYVLGEVMRPSMYALRDNTTVLSAVMAAGGPTPRGKMRGTVLIRGSAENPEKIPVDIAKLVDSGDVSQDIELKPGDVVYVPETNKPDWSKISSFLNALISVGYLRRYGLF